MKRKLIIIAISVILLVPSILFYVNYASASVTKVFSSFETVPGYYWCQHTNGTWSTFSDIDGYVTSPNAGGVPAKNV